MKGPEAHVTWRDLRSYIHKVLAMYENFFMFFFIVVGVLMTGVGAYCIPNNQEMANLSGNKEFMRDLSG